MRRKLLNRDRNATLHFPAASPWAAIVALPGFAQSTAHFQRQLVPSDFTRAGVSVCVVSAGADRNWQAGGSFTRSDLDRIREHTLNHTHYRVPWFVAGHSKGGRMAWRLLTLASHVDWLQPCAGWIVNAGGLPRNCELGGKSKGRHLYAQRGSQDRTPERKHHDAAVESAKQAGMRVESVVIEGARHAWCRENNAAVCEWMREIVEGSAT